VVVFSLKVTFFKPLNSSSMVRIDTWKRTADVVPEVIP
jgi:hypothetical protein